MTYLRKYKNIPITDTIKRFSFGSTRMLYDYIKTKKGGNVVIYGSYNTANVGDLAIGLTLKRYIEKKYNLSVLLNGIISNKQDFSKFDLCILGGGQIHKSYTSGNKLESIKSTNSLAIGIGLSNKTLVHKKLLKNLEETKLITVRDKKSKEILSSVINKEIYDTACPAFHFDAFAKNKEINTIDNSIGISFRDFESRCYRKKYITFLEENLKRLSKNYDLYFIPFAFQDISFANKYFNKYFKKILSFSSPERTYDTVRSMERIIGGRFHSCIFGILAEKPLCILMYENKMEDIADDACFSVDINNLDRRKKIIFDDKKTIKKIKDKYQRKATENFTLIDSVLRS